MNSVGLKYNQPHGFLLKVIHVNIKLIAAVFLTKTLPGFPYYFFKLHAFKTLIFN